MIAAYAVTWKGIPLHVHYDTEGICLIVAVPVDDDEGTLGDDLCAYLTLSAFEEIDNLVYESIKEAS